VLIKYVVPIALFGSIVTSSVCQAEGTETGRYITRERIVKSGKQTNVTAFNQVNPDCSAGRLPNIKIVSGPAHGKLVLSRQQLNPKFNSGDLRHKCNSRKLPVTVLLYTSDKGFSGLDKIRVVAKGVVDDNYHFLDLRLKVAK
jgi:hypothetical protein